MNNDFISSAAFQILFKNQSKNLHNLLLLKNSVSESAISSSSDRTIIQWQKIRVIVVGQILPDQKITTHASPMRKMWGR